MYGKMKNMKKIRYMNKTELTEVFNRFDIPTVDPETGDEFSKKEMVYDLVNVYGVNDEKLAEFEEKKDTQLTDGKEEYSEFVEDEHGAVVMRMDRNNSSFGIGNKIFTTRARYQLVTAEQAEQLLAMGGFSKATKEEIERAFK